MSKTARKKKKKKKKKKKMKKWACDAMTQTLWGRNKERFGLISYLDGDATMTQFSTLHVI